MAGLISDGGRLPERIIVFDGVCVLCIRWIAFVLTHDGAGLFQFAAMQSDTGRTLLLQHGLDPHSPASFLLLDGEQALTDSAAIVRLLTLLGGRWRWLGKALSEVPKGWRDAGYLFIARHRYRWFGRLESCTVAAPEQLHRFLK